MEAQTPSGEPGDGTAVPAAIGALQQRARAAGITLRAPPPEPTTCCGRGCSGCVWESYDNAVDYWCEQAEEALRKLGDASPPA